MAKSVYETLNGGDLFGNFSDAKEEIGNCAPNDSPHTAWSVRSGGRGGGSVQIYVHKLVRINEKTGDFGKDL